MGEFAGICTSTLYKRLQQAWRVVNIRQRRLRKGMQWPISQHSSDLDPDPDRLSEEEMEQIVRYEISEYGSGPDYGAVERRLMNDLLRAGQFDENPRANAYKECHLVGLMTESSSPEILYVCEKSHGMVLASYTQCFRSLGSITETWFNFDIDTLYLRYDTYNVSYPIGEAAYDNEHLKDLVESGARILDRKKMRRVKKLAISLDLEDSPSPSLETLLAVILRFFSQLDELYLVIGHFQLGKARDDQRDLSIMDPVENDSTISNYEDFQFMSEYPTTEVPEEASIDPSIAGIASFDMKFSQLYLNGDVLEGKTPWVIPKISTKVAVSQKCLDRFQRAKTACAEYRAALISSANAHVVVHTGESGNVKKCNYGDLPCVSRIL